MPHRTSKRTSADRRTESLPISGFQSPEPDRATPIQAPTPPWTKCRGSPGHLTAAIPKPNRHHERFLSSADGLRLPRCRSNAREARCQSPFRVGIPRVSPAKRGGKALAEETPASEQLDLVSQGPVACQTSRTLARHRQKSRRQ